VVQLRTNNARQPGDRDHEEGVAFHPTPVEIRLQDVSGCDQRQRDHQSKGGNCERSQMKVGNHSSVFAKLFKSIHERINQAARDRA
jgi:hypothetical protein